MQGGVEMWMLKRGGSAKKGIIKLGKGSIFGAESFMTRSASICGASSVNIVTIVQLNFCDFAEVLQKYPLDFEKFCFLRDNLVFNKKTDGLGLKCEACG